MKTTDKTEIKPVNAKSALIVFYLEWVNDWLTVERMAEYYGLPEGLCKKMIELGKQLHELQFSIR